MSRDETRPSLLIRLRNPNDETAWSEFDRVYRDLILGYLERRGMDGADAEEIYSNVLVGMNQSLARFEYRPERGRFRDYLRRAVQNAILTSLRRRRRAPDRLETSVESGLEAPDTAEADDVWDEEWRGFHYRRAMSTLRREYDARNLDAFDRLIDGEPVADVAEKMGMSQQAVHKIKQRFRDRIREIIRRQVEEEDGV